MIWLEWVEYYVLLRMRSRINMALLDYHFRKCNSIVRNKFKSFQPRSNALKFVCRLSTSIVSIHIARAWNVLNIYQDIFSTRTVSARIQRTNAGRVVKSTSGWHLLRASRALFDWNHMPRVKTHCCETTQNIMLRQYPEQLGTCQARDEQMWRQRK